jgi:hypothetical protein
MKKIFKAKIFKDDVNSWQLDDADCIFEHSKPLDNKSFTRNWEGSYTRFDPPLSLKIYKRNNRVKGGMLGGIFYSFVLGWYKLVNQTMKDEHSEWIAIEGFNLTEDQIKHIFYKVPTPQKEEKI